MILRSPYPDVPPAPAHPFVEDGLLAVWLFDEGSGSVVEDLSGNGYDLTKTGGTWTSTGISSPGDARLDTSLPQVPEVSILAVASAQPMSSYNRLYSWGAYPGDWRLSGIRAPGPSRIVGPIHLQDGSVPLTSEYVYTEDGTAFCHGYSYGGNQYRGFWQGALDSPISMPGTLFTLGTGPREFRIFGDVNPSEPRWVGSIHAVLLYSRVLTPAEWAENYSQLQSIMAGRGLSLP